MTLHRILTFCCPQSLRHLGLVILFAFNINCLFVGNDLVQDSVSSRMKRRLCPSRQTPQVDGPIETPTERVSPEQAPFFKDDLNFKNMKKALSRQLKRFDQKELEGTIRLGQTHYSVTRVVKTLSSFKDLVTRTQTCFEQKKTTFCYRRFRNEIKNEYNIYRPVKDSKSPGEPTARFTGYYTPLLQGRLERSKEYQHAIYMRPGRKDLLESTRVQIDFENRLQGHGLGLVFTQDLFELYLMHVEGGGKVELQDGHSFYLSFDGSNHKKWRFISQYMIEKGWIEESSVEAQRRFLENHPELRKEIYSSCPSYIYFKVTTTPPEGSDLVPLTQNRSLATDRSHYPFKGLLAFIQTKRPGEEASMRNFSRFVVDQDTGGAIEGKARADIYFGEGEYAQKAAYNVDHPGHLYFLMLKSQEQ